MEDINNHYVYAYYDPRNFKMFYVGMGKGKRKIVHLQEKTDSHKSKTILDITKEGLEPIIRVLAKDLTEEQAKLVEKSIIWMNYDTLSNISTGNFSNNFRPDNTLHKNVLGFDYQTGIYYVNVGEDDSRDWNDCMNYNFLCAGGDPKWRDPLKRLVIGDIVVAYLKGKGYVGIGKITSTIQKVIDFKTIDGTKLIEFKNSLVQPDIFLNCHDDDLSQYLVGVDWIKIRTKNNAVSVKGKKLYTTQHIVASLLNQSFTLDFIENEFGVKFNDLIE